MIQNRTFIIAASLPWGELFGNDMRDMAGEIAQDNKVLYVNPPVYSVAIDSEISSDADKYAVTNPKPNVWVLEFSVAATGSTHPDDAPEILDEEHNEQYAVAIKWAAAQLGFDLPDSYLLLSNDHLILSRLTEKLPVRLSLYYRNGKTGINPVSVYKAVRLEQETAREANIVLTNSAHVVSELRQYNSETYNIGSGADLSAYQIGTTYPRPHDIADIDTPIIGCAGTVSSIYLSPTILYQLAITFPDATIVILGKKDPLIMNHPVHRMPNVRFLGAKSEAELPAYIAAFDVCIDPAVNKHPNSRYRNAIINYLALGKSVVCNDMEYTQPFCDYVLIAHFEKEFVEKVSWALHTRLPWSIRYKRAEFAHTFSWSKCVERLYVVLVMAEADKAKKEKSGGEMQQSFC